LAEIVIIAVVIVASIYTAGAAAEGFGATATAAGSTSTFEIGAAALSGGGLVGGVAGATVAVGAGVGLGAAAIGGFAGSVAGQLTGDALGASHGFSLEQALTAGLAAGLTAGIGGEINASGGEFSPLANGQGALRPAGAALFGAGAYGSGVAAAKITGQAEHFSWAGLAAAAVASGLTAEAGLNGGPLQKLGLSNGTFQGDVAGSLLSGGVDRETSLLLGDHHVASWASIGEDAFGNALGNAAIRGYENAVIKSKLANLSQEAQKGFHELEAQGVNPDKALQGAIAFDAATNRPLAANNPTFNNLPQATTLGGSYNYSSDQVTAYLQVLAEPNLSSHGIYDEAQDVAGLVPIAGRVNALNASLASMNPSDPNYANLRAISQEMTYALVSKDVYFNNSIPQILPEGITRLDNGQIANTPGISELSAPGLLVDEAKTNNSGFFSAVYQNANSLDAAGSASYIIADRGSQSLASWGNDVEQAVGMDAKQYDLAEIVAKAVKDQGLKFGASGPTITFAGHSLGGGLASLQAYITGDQAFTFNAAGLTQSTLGHAQVTLEQQKQDRHLSHEIYTSGDILDMLQDDTPLPLSAGMRTEIPSVNYNNLQDNSETPLSWYQKANPLVWAQQHGMTYVIHALNYQLTQQLNDTSGGL
jgi:hypothetical protein